MGCLSSSRMQQRRYILVPPSATKNFEIMDSERVAAAPGSVKPPATSLVVTKEHNGFCCCRRKTRIAKPPNSFVFVGEEFEQSSFVVTVEHPETGKTHLFNARTDEPELTLPHVMSWIMYDDEQGELFDASFMSFYNEKK